jgi:glycosyltransferase involved in cell wall biosynthesis
MDIGIDTHHLDGKPQGSRTYLLGLVPELARLAPEDRFFLYSFNPSATGKLLDAPNVIHRRVFPETARLRTPFVVPALELIDGVKVFHSQYICPPVSFVPEVVSIHDILFETHPDLFVGAFSRASVWLIRRSARRARYVLTVSEFSRRALLERYELPESKVVVTPDAVDPERFRPLEPGPALDDVRQRYELDGPFILNVGRLEPRKNLERLIQAFDQVRRRVDSALKLIIVGKEDFRFETIHEEADKLPEGIVRFLGPVPDADLPAIYNLADLMAYPSLVEGFGMPLVEAMACGTPVVASKRGALPEVGGDAAIWIDPEDEDSMVSGLELCLTDSETASNRRRAGLERAKLFRWEETAKRTLEVYHQFGS